MTTREHTVERTPILAERTIRCHLHPQLPIERTILNGLADMLRHESFGCRQACDGASPFQDPVVGAGAELQFVHRHFEQLTMQKTLITVTITAAVGTGIYEYRQAKKRTAAPIYCSGHGQSWQ